MITPPTKPYKFGEYEISPGRRELTYNGRPVALGDRAFDILVALANRPGQLVTKRELMKLVWRETIVDERTVTAQISILRRALGEQSKFIRTVAGRGYQFVVDTSDRQLEHVHILLDLPASMSPLIGREVALKELQSLTTAHRLITLVGAGGVGKTRLAVEVARQLATSFGGRVSMSELAPLTQTEFVATTVAKALGVDVADDDTSSDRISSVLGDRRTLLVLDNCEHVLGASAELVKMLLRAAPGVHIIATSREPLRVEREYVYRVPSLDIPPDGEEDVDTVMTTSALQMFEDRLGRKHASSTDDPAIVALKAKICRRLDGIPLAIELAAARADVFGIAGLSDRLENHFEILAGGSRTSLPRQQTLAAMLDWSFQLLSPDERTVLERLSVFANEFTLNAAQDVVTTPDLRSTVFVSCVANLVSKSLVTLNLEGPGSTYRLLRMTRTYCFRKMQEQGEGNEVSRRHAAYLHRHFRAVEADWESTLTDNWIAQFEAHLEDIRAAILWSFSGSGDTDLGIALTAAAVPFWLRSSRVQECLTNVTLALQCVENDGAGTPRNTMKLYIAFGKANLLGGAIAETAKAFDLALNIADKIKDEEHQLLAIWGMWAFTYLRGPYDKLLTLSRRFCDITARRPDAADRAVGQRMLATAYLCLGQLDNAVVHLESMLAGYRAPPSRSHLIRFGFDQTVTSLCALAYTRWLQGFPEQAIDLSGQAIRHARSIDHGGSVWYALALGVCPIVLLTHGVSALIAPYAELLQAARHFGMPVWQSRTSFWWGLTQMEQGHADAYESIVTPSLLARGDTRYASYLTGYMSALCVQLSRNGQVGEARDLIDATLIRAQNTHDLAGFPELLRMKGELILAQATPDAQSLAEAAFVASLDASNATGAVSWALRAATSLARLLMHEGKRAQAREVLEPIYARFAEGFGTIDLIAARDVLNKAAEA